MLSHSIELHHLETREMITLVLSHYIFQLYYLMYYELNKLQLKSSLCYRQKYDLIFTNEVCNASLTISSQKFDIYRQVHYKTAQYVDISYHPLSLKIINNYKTVLHSAHQVYIVEITLLYRNIQPRCNILCCALL